MRNVMEHNPLISYNNGLEITYSDLKRDNRGEYVTIYFERPNDNKTMFDSAQIDYPFGSFTNVQGFTTEDYALLNDQVRRNGELALSFSKENAYA